jgi:hypothetical protein
MSFLGNQNSRLLGKPLSKKESRMKKKTWQVWTEEDNHDVIVFSGSHATCLSYYKKNGGSKAGLHIGYDCGSIDEI